jgi:mono/diheme cytochrome c family protein
MSRSFPRRAVRPRRPALLVLACLVGAGLSGACRQDMHDAPRYDPLEASPVFAGGAASQPLVDGTVARGHLRADTHLYTGTVGDEPATVFPFPITAADLDRGQERFNIYCAPCHGRTGVGDGMVVQRGHRQAASFHIQRLREMPVGYFFDVITNGFGAMPDYQSQIPVEDRWRIVAFVRALQLSHAGTLDDVPASERPQLEGGAAAGSGSGSGAEGGGSR